MKHKSEQSALSKNKVIAALPFGSDMIFGALIDDNKELAKLIIEIITDLKNIEVLQVKSQSHVNSITGRSVIFDARVKLEDGTEVVIEVQRKRHDMSLKRIRYYGSILDTKMLEPGDNYDKLPNRIVIVLLEGDAFGKRLPLYRLGLAIKETGAFVEDGTMIYIANTTLRNPYTALGRLMNDLSATTPSEAFFPPIAEGIRRLKYGEKGATKMTELYDDYMRAKYAEGEAKGRAEGRVEGSADAFNVLADYCAGKLSAEEAARLLGQPVEKLKTFPY